MQAIIPVFFPQVRAIVWLLVAIGSILLFRKVRGWPAVLLVVGSAAYFVMELDNVIFMYAMTYEWIPLNARFWQHWGFYVWDNTLGVATLCFPIGFLSFALRATRST